MTYPVVESVTTTELSGDNLNHDFDLPGTVNSGDLLIALFGFEGDVDDGLISGWTEVVINGQSLRSISIFKKIAGGSESATNNIDLNGYRARGASQVWRISGWSGDLDDVEVSAVGGSSSGSSHDPPTLTASWGADDNLWIAVAAYGNDSETVSGYPTSFSENQTAVEANGGLNTTGGVAAAGRFYNGGATLDPSAFTIGGSTASRTATLVVRPSSASPSTYPVNPFGHPFAGPFAGPIS